MWFQDSGSQVLSLSLQGISEFERVFAVYNWLQDLGLRFQGWTVPDFGFRIHGFGFRIDIWASVSGFRALVSEFEVWISSFEITLHYVKWFQDVDASGFEHGFTMKYVWFQHPKH